jgi:hypothetical protein
VNEIVVAAFATVLGLLASEIGGWAELLAGALIRLAVRSLPTTARAQYSEEWLTELSDVRSGVGKIVYSFNLLIRSRRLKSVIARETEEEIAKDFSHEHSRLVYTRITILAIGVVLGIGLAVALIIFSLSSTSVPSETIALAAASGGALTSGATLLYGFVRQYKHDADNANETSDDD